MLPMMKFRYENQIKDIELDSTRSIFFIYFYAMLGKT